MVISHIGLRFFLFSWFSGFDTLVEDALVDTNSPCFWQLPRAFSVIFENVPKQLEYSRFSETEFVGVLGGASFRTNLQAVLVLDYTRTLLNNTYMAIGAFP